MHWTMLSGKEIDRLLSCKINMQCKKRSQSFMKYLYYKDAGSCDYWMYDYGGICTKYFIQHTAPETVHQSLYYSGKCE